MVNITVTPEAAERIRKRMAGRNLSLKLKYETDGCGCVVSGVTVLELVDGTELDPDKMLVETNEMPVIIEKTKLIFLDEELKIDYSESSQTFRLVSPGQILNGRMSLREK